MNLRTVVVGGLAAVLCGCGGSAGVDKVPVVPVKGTLYIDDKPFGPALMQLNLDPPDVKVPAVNAYVKPDGSFSLQTYGEGDGAPVGNYKVTLMMDPMQPGNTPMVKPASVSVAKPSGSEPVKLDIKLESSGAMMTSPLPPPPGQGPRN